MHCVNICTMEKIYLFVSFRSNPKIKEVDTVHAKDIGTMSVNQLQTKIQETKKSDSKICDEMK